MVSRTVLPVVVDPPGVVVVEVAPAAVTGVTPGPGATVVDVPGSPVDVPGSPVDWPGPGP